MFGCVYSSSWSELDHPWQTTRYFVEKSQQFSLPWKQKMIKAKGLLSTAINYFLQVNTLLDTFTFLPQNFPVFSQTGCKQVQQTTCFLYFSSNLNFLTSNLRCPAVLISSWVGDMGISSRGQGSFPRTLKKYLKWKPKQITFGRHLDWYWGNPISVQSFMFWLPP